MMNYRTLLALTGIALAALFLRFYQLDRSAVRGDEINFLNVAANGQTLEALWKNPPWLNQIPFAESFSILWARIRPGATNEGTVREPFALMGWLTVIGSTWWLMRRRGVFPGLIYGWWLALLPFHVYQSREAYYYVIVMAFSTGLTLCSAHLSARLRQGEEPARGAYLWWTFWAVTTCLCHMSTWIVTAVMWLVVLLAGRRALPPAVRKRHIKRMAGSAVVVGLFMVRWIWRAYLEIQRVSQADGHIGGDLGWVSVRVIPFFLVGANWAGFAAALLLVVVALALWWRLRSKTGVPPDPFYDSMLLIMAAGFAAAGLYVGFIGGGLAKSTYFSCLLPAFLIWTVLTLERAIGLLPVGWARGSRVLLVALIALLFYPSLVMSRLDGKPVPYKVIRDWLDQHLEAGSVAVVDRWYEPWNEMARYAPTNVVVTFTVPDEPFQNYQQFQWRDVTRQKIESGQVQAFIRLTRNHEQKAGLWRWPETYFARHAVVRNEAGLWLREHGYAGHEDFYVANTNRLVVEIFYDLREDALARIRSTGTSFRVFYGPGLAYEKSGPMGIFRFQTAQFMDWRVLSQRGTLDVYNLTGSPAEVSLVVAGLSPRGSKTVTAPGGRHFQFSGTQLQRWLLGPVSLQPGLNAITLEDPLWDRAMNPLLISEVAVVP